jgi:hypothetical protein
MESLSCAVCEEIQEIGIGERGGAICIFCGAIGQFLSTDPIPKAILSKFIEISQEQSMTWEGKTKFHRVRHGKYKLDSLDRAHATKLYRLISTPTDRSPPDSMVSDIEYLRSGRAVWEEQTGQKVKARVSKEVYASQAWGSLWHWLLSAKIREIPDDFIPVNRRISLYSRTTGEKLASGRPDGVFREGGNYIPIEIKSCSDSSFQVGKIKQNWIEQTKKYATMARLLGWLEEPRTILIIINRETAQWTAGVINFENLETEPILSQWEIFPRISPSLIAEFLSRNPESNLDVMEIEIYKVLRKYL